MLFSKSKETDRSTGQSDQLKTLVEEIGNRQLAYQDRTDDILAKLLDRLETGQTEETVSGDQELSPTRDISLEAHMTDQARLEMHADKYKRLATRSVGAMTVDGLFVCVYETVKGKLKFKLFDPSTDKFSAWVKLDGLELEINIIDQETSQALPMSNITKQAPKETTTGQALMSNLPKETVKETTTGQALMSNLPSGLTPNQIDTTPKAMVNCRAIRPTCQTAVALNNVTGVKWPLHLQVYAYLSHDKRTNLPLDGCVQDIKKALTKAFKSAGFDRSYYVQQEGQHIYICLDFPYVRKGKNNNYVGSVYEAVNKQIELVNYPEGNIPQTI